MLIPYNYLTVENWIYDVLGESDWEVTILDIIAQHAKSVGQKYENLELHFFGDWQDETDFTNHSFIYRSLIENQLRQIARYVSSSGSEIVKLNPTSTEDNNIVHSGYDYSIEEDAPLSAGQNFPTNNGTGIDNPSFKDSRHKNFSDTISKNFTNNKELLESIEATKLIPTVYAMVESMCNNLVQEYQKIY